MNVRSPACAAVLVLAAAAGFAQEPIAGLTAEQSHELEMLRAQLFGMGRSAEEVDRAVRERATGMLGGAAPASGTADAGATDPVGAPASRAEGWFLGVAADGRAALLLGDDGTERAFPLRRPRGCRLVPEPGLGRYLRTVERGDRVAFLHATEASDFLMGCAVLSPRLPAMARGRVVSGSPLRVEIAGAVREVSLPAGRGADADLLRTAGQIEPGDEVVLEGWEGAGRFTLCEVTWEALGPGKSRTVRDQVEALRNEVESRVSRGEVLLDDIPLETTSRLAEFLFAWEPGAAAALDDAARIPTGCDPFDRQIALLRGMLDGGGATAAVRVATRPAAAAPDTRPVVNGTGRVTGWVVQSSPGEALDLAVDGGESLRIPVARGPAASSMPPRPDLRSVMGALQPGDRVSAGFHDSDQGIFLRDCTRLAARRIRSLRAEVLAPEAGTRAVRVRSIPAGRIFTLETSALVLGGGGLAFTGVESGDRILLEGTVAGDRYFAMCFLGYDGLSDRKKDVIRNCLRGMLPIGAQGGTASRALEQSAAQWMPASMRFLAALDRLESDAEMVGFMPAGMDPSLRLAFHRDVHRVVRGLSTLPMPVAGVSSGPPASDLEYTVEEGE